MPDHRRAPVTAAIHTRRATSLARPVSSPIFQTTTFALPSAADLSRAAIEVAAPGFYTRHGNPNHLELAYAVATLEGAERGLVFGSGMGALTTAVLALVRAGDHVVAQRSMYGGSLSLVQALLPRLGVECTLVEQTDVSAWVDAVTPATRLFLIESPSCPAIVRLLLSRQTHQRARTAAHLLPPVVAPIAVKRAAKRQDSSGNFAVVLSKGGYSTTPSRWR